MIVRWREAALGAALGLLAGFLAWSLGFWQVTPIRNDDVVIAALGGVGAIVAGLGAAVWILALNGALLLVWAVIAATPLMFSLTGGWVRNDSWSQPKVDAVVVLSSYIRSNDDLDALSTDRLLSGLSLVRGGVAPRLVTTRVVAKIHGTRLLSDDDQRRLVHLAGLDSVWTEVDSVGSTRDEARLTAQLLLPKARTIAVVTSPMHTRRACAVFEAVGFRVFCVASRESENNTWHPVTADDRLAAFRQYLYERLGMIKYGWKGWVRG